MAKNPLIFKKVHRNKFSAPGNQSAGIFDDYAVRKNVATREGTIEKVPVNDSDISNKKYVDDEISSIDLTPYVEKAGDTMTGTLSGSNIAMTDGTIAGMNIDNDGTKTTFLGKSGDYNRIGDAGTQQSGVINSEDDLLVTDDFEVGGDSFFMGKVQVLVSSSGAVDALTLKDTVGRVFYRYVMYGGDGMHLGIAPDDGGARQNLILTSYGNRAKNHDHSQSTNPTFWVHSATNPDTNNTQWLSSTHDQTDGVITTGKGNINLDAAGDGVLIVSGGNLYIPGLKKIDGSTPAADGDALKFEITTGRIYGG